ncbi:gamma-glutamylcyclotransferase [Wenzhouxiangella sp. AB-CW3]|uniref:gamma-glutamylcyclotransferase family protein n=1 Tax=Wenzhouxiangella sp. AB-CW3 TaxID=2771012 RepID=UPI00168C04AA|nr:gamma-glutamylcyclotransferase family protein [Wenzhouxiangella sp. AB-CW3]QOC21754.1 gamma-glutamylcyclotransferase [Wenzhouxiangella sp. AB-CW3]
MPDASPLIYLAYGSNLHPHRLRERIGDIELAGVVGLPGWRLCFDKRGADGSAKANLRPMPGSDHCAWAAAYRVHEYQLPVLDQFEGCGGGYETFRFDVCIGKQWVPALAYLTPSHWTTQIMHPYDWYCALVAAGARYHSLPQAYIDMVEAQPAVADSDLARRRHHMRTVQQCRATTPSPLP